MKKTIKLSKSKTKELSKKNEEEKKGRIHELKKHKSMEIITKEAEPTNKNSQNFRTKIDELNQKLNSIK